ncbi:MAG: acyl-CoA dehydrogenase family protein [Deltaproteobacteria bacterium]|nr:acyl-CoA dehydrogenase family protein [Deltaproteobacteria bacterium]
MRGAGESAAARFGELTDVQAAVQRTFADFADRELVPVASRLDEKGELDRALFKKVGELGFFGMRYPVELGGSAADTLSLCLAAEELARGWLSLAAGSMMQALMGTWLVYRSGNAELHERLLKPAILGEKIGTICMTEPDAGSDLKGITTRADPEGDGYRITGKKTWITNAPVADFFTVFAKTGKTLSTFVVEARTEGVRVGRPIGKMGVRSSPTSEVFFDGAYVPKSQRVGDEGQGADYLAEILPQIRTVTGALALGVGRAAFDAARRYSLERKQFGKPIAEFQAVKLKIAAMATELFATEQVVRRAATLADRGASSAGVAAICKSFASESAARVCDDAARVLASYGYSTDYPVERYLRDVRFTLIGGGTPEILALAIAREALEGAP